MKKSFFVKMLIPALLVMGMIGMTGCDNPSGDDPVYGMLTITNLPAGHSYGVVVYDYAGSLSNQLGFASAATGAAIAFSPENTSSSPIALLAMSSEAFDRTGILLTAITEDETAVKFKTSVFFNTGNATIDYDDLVILTSLPLTNGDSTAVTFNSLSANGSDETTTILTLTFDRDITGLTAADIDITAGITGIELTRTGTGIYDLTVSGISAEGSVTVTPVKAGYDINPAYKTVTVYLEPPEEP